jgi:hypothetical protein
LIGDEVNLASRLEAMCKHYDVEVLISGAMYDRVAHAFLARPIDRVVAVGKTRPVDVYELLAPQASATPAQRAACAAFEALVAAYRARDFAAALVMAEDYMSLHPTDAPANKC